MKNRGLILILSFGLLLFFSACGENKKDKKAVIKDGFTSGTAVFAADESFSPIVGEEEYVFKALYPDAKPVIRYIPESEVVNQLLNDKVRVAIISRELDTTETGILRRRALAPDVDKSIVFDNPNSSLVRYFKQISGNKDFTQKNIYALKSNKEVIKYVSEHPNAIGITGFAWLNDPDKDYADAVAKVKIVGVKDDTNKKAPGEYFKPSQTTLVQHTYPLSRSLYIVDCTGRKGLGAGFASFLKSERGQRIILKSGLLPDSIPTREINITH
jgi:phosphate transport system substrate-binding protein